MDINQESHQHTDNSKNGAELVQGGENLVCDSLKAIEVFGKNKTQAEDITKVTRPGLPWKKLLHHMQQEKLTPKPYK